MTRRMILKMGLAGGALVAVIAAGLKLSTRRSEPSGLRVDYGPHGVERLSYRGVMLEDAAQNPLDVLHIWHMKMTGIDGVPRSDGQYGWGENNDGKTWDNAARAWTYRFTWGSIIVQFVQAGDRLDIKVTEHNDLGSGVILHGATIYPLALHFPQIPRGFGEPAAHLAFNSDGPSVVLADYSAGEIETVVPDAARPLYSGFVPSGPPHVYTPVISSTVLDQMATFQPHFDRPVAPGETDSFTVSLRFAPSGIDPASLATDAYKNWSKTWPAELHWADRRIIGTIYLASSPPSAGDINHPNGFPNNPRRYFNDADEADFDLRTQNGMGRFQQRVLRQARASVEVLQRLHAQGAITWDIEGEQFPQDTSYVCAPDQIARVAPEMESMVSDAGSIYAGMKLDDAWFKTFRDAGFRVGICVRPQQFLLAPDGSGQQVYLSGAMIAAELIRKMRYAHDRWGATLFYLDSTVEKNGAALDASIVQQAAAALPDSLLIPEEATPRDYAYAAPFKSFLFHEDSGTDAAAFRFYPDAFSVNLINDADPAKLQSAFGTLVDRVRHGDILMCHADYWQANNPLLMQIYREAGRTQ